jgi:purine-cytosine permease-like protein
MTKIELFHQMFGWIGSIRAWLALAITLTVCWLAIKEVVSAEAFVALAVLALNYYFLEKKREV